MNRHIILAAGLTLGSALSAAVPSQAALMLNEDFTTTTITADASGTNSFDFADFDSGDGWYTSGDIGTQRSWGTFPDKGPAGIGDTSASLAYDNPFSGGLAYIAADAKASTGVYDFSFDYKATSPGNVGVNVWGVLDSDNNGWDGGFQTSGGSGGFGPNQAGFGNRTGGGLEGIKLLDRRTVGVVGGEQLIADGDWQTYATTIDLGTGFDYLILGFGGNDAVGDNPGLAPDLVGIDNVRFSAAIPEPAAFGLVLVGLVAVAARRI